MSSQLKLVRFLLLIFLKGSLLLYVGFIGVKLCVGFFFNPLSIITASFPVLSPCPGMRPVSTEDKKLCLRSVS